MKGRKRGFSQSSRLGLNTFSRTTLQVCNWAWGGDCVGSEKTGQRQLLLPINDSSFCRRRVGKGAPLATAAQRSLWDGSQVRPKARARLRLQLDDLSGLQDGGRADVTGTLLLITRTRLA